MKRRKISKAERRRIFAKTNGRCAYCGCDLCGLKWDADHIIPLSQNGKDDESNMIASCRSCNHRKGSSGIESFRSQIERFPEVLSRDSVTYRNAVRYGLVVPNPKKIIFYFENLK